MKSKLHFHKIIIIAIFCMFSCSKEEEEKDDSNLVQEVKINGTILSTAVDFSTLTVTSPIDQSTVTSSGGFSLDLPVNYSATFVVNAEGKEMMMGYSYPGNPDSNIDAESTALGMLMLSPAMIQLSPIGKQQYINSILNSAKLNTFIALINDKINSGTPLFENNSAAFANAYQALFTDVSNRSNQQSNNNDLPINFYRNGRTCYFNNSGNTYLTIVAVYRNDILIDKVYVEGMKLLPNYLSNVFGGFASPAGLNVDKTYTLPGDGQYTFKFYTGNGTNDQSPEFWEAFWENLTDYSMSVVSSILPQLTVSQCVTSVRTTFLNAIINDPLLNADITPVAELPIRSSKVTFNNVSGWSNCVGINTTDNWFASAGNLYDFVADCYGLSALYGANASVFATQWLGSDSGASKCFLVTGESITDCENPLIGQWSMILFDYNIPVGSFATTYDSTCPSKINYLEYESGTITFNETGYSWAWSNLIVVKHYVFEPGTCNLAQEFPDTLETDSKSDSGTYQFNGTNYIFIEGSGDQYPIVFLTPNKIKIYDQTFVRM